MCSMEWKLGQSFKPVQLQWLRRGHSVLRNGLDSDVKCAT